jgi:hypothetical protein
MPCLKLSPSAIAWALAYNCAALGFTFKGSYCACTLQQKMNDRIVNKHFMAENYKSKIKARA